MSQSLEEKLEALTKEFCKPDMTQEESMDFTKSLQKKVLQKTLNIEMEQHLGYAKHDKQGRGSGNNRNGSSRKQSEQSIPN